MTREMVFERNLTGSYMKIMAEKDHCFDEQVLLGRSISGLLPVEKSFLDGRGQYWFGISGKQSLDTFCSIKDIEMEFIEQVIIGVCNEVEILERNLLDVNCLSLEPEMIYVSNQDRELFFTFLPGMQENLLDQFRKLMEYLLTKVDHKDPAAVEAAYGVYAKCTEEGYSLTDIRSAIVDAKMKKHEKQETSAADTEQLDLDMIRELNTAMEDSKEELARSPKSSAKKSLLQNDDYSQQAGKSGKRKIRTRLPEGEIRTKREHGKVIAKKSLIDRIRNLILHALDELKGEYPEDDTWQNMDWRKEWTRDVIEPEEASLQETILPEIHPTVCLSNYEPYPDGILLYEGSERLGNIRLSEGKTNIGKGADADAEIPRDTISHLHAVINRKEHEFYIEDMNSMNGTFVNGEALSYKEKRLLKMNDIIRFADVKYRFV